MSKSNSFTVYRLTFPDNKSYVGATGAFKARVRSHKFAAFRGGTRPIQKALYKFGWDATKLDVIAFDLVEQDAYTLEVAKIKEFDSKNNGYNCADGGKINRGYTTGIAWNRDKKLTVAHRQAMIDAKAGKNYSEISSDNSSKFPITATNVDGRVLKFKNAIEFAEYIGVKFSSVYTHIYRNSKLLINEWTVRRTT